MSERNTSRLTRLKTLSEIAGIWLALIGGFVGGILAFNEYLQSRRELRVATTLDYVKTFRGLELQTARNHINKRWIEVDGFEEALEKGDDALAEFVVETDYPIAMEIAQVVDFYESLHVCIQEGLCDRKTAAAFFLAEAKRFREAHFYGLEMIRQMTSDPTFGSLFSEFAPMQGENP